MAWDHRIVGLIAELQAKAEAEQRRSAAREAGEALRNSIADLGRRSDEYGGRTAAALEALLTLTQEQARDAEEREERERTMLALTRRSVWISLAATFAGFVSAAVAIVAVF